jgi:hypothetical protein
LEEARSDGKGLPACQGASRGSMFLTAWEWDQDRMVGTEVVYGIMKDGLNGLTAEEAAQPTPEPLAGSGERPEAERP